MSLTTDERAMLDHLNSICDKDESNSSYHVWIKQGVRIDELEKENKKLTDKTHKESSLEKWVYLWTKQNARIEELEQENEKLVERAEFANKYLREYCHKSMKYVREINSLRAENKILKENHSLSTSDAATAEIERRKVVISGLMDKIRYLEEENDKLAPGKPAAKILMTKIRELEKDNQNLKDNIDYIVENERNVRKENDNLKRDNTYMRQQLAEYSDKLDVVMQESFRLQPENESLKVEASHLKERIIFIFGAIDKIRMAIDDVMRLRG